MKSEKLKVESGIVVQNRRGIAAAKGVLMLYPFMTLDDQTEIVHSESYTENGKEYVRVEIEKPIPGGFASAECILPDYQWNRISGFSPKEIESLTEIIESTAHIIFRLARDGGFDNASGF